MPTWYSLVFQSIVPGLGHLVQASRWSGTAAGSCPSRSIVRDVGIEMEREVRGLEPDESPVQLVPDAVGVERVQVR